MTDQTHQIPSQLQMGREYGMQLLDQALLAAINAKQVDPEQAYMYANDKRQFQRFVTDLSGIVGAAGDRPAGAGAAGERLPEPGASLPAGS
jgi:hypothetical protein